MTTVAKKYRNEYRKRKRDYLRELLAAGVCVDCGVNNPVVLQFHHVQPGSDIGQMAQQNRTWKQIKDEVAKCVILCANCHIIRHHNEQTGYNAQRKP